MTDEEKQRERERKEIQFLIANIVAIGYADGMDEVAREYDLRHLVPAAGERMPAFLKERLKIIDESLKAYREQIGAKVTELRGAGLTPVQVHAEIQTQAQRLADRKADIIAETEYATAKLRGAKEVLGDSEMEFEWRFVHMFLGAPGHEECEACAEIADGSPYTSEEAIEQGFPDLVHLNCDHSWLCVPTSNISRTEEFPPIV